MSLSKTFVSLLLLATSSAFAAEMSEPVPAALTKVKAGEAVIIDVREADEIKEGIIEQAIWLPTSEIKAKGPRYEEILKSLPKDKPIYTYCAAGVRAEAFSDILEAQGYTTANLGGYPELVVAGFSTKTVADAKLQPCPYLCALPAVVATPTPVPTATPAPAPKK